MRLTALYIGLAVLAAGIIFLGAQEVFQPAEAGGQANASLTNSAEKPAAGSTSEGENAAEINEKTTAAESFAEPNQSSTTSAAESDPVETNVVAEESRNEPKPEEAEAGIVSPVKKTGSKTSPPMEFEIDRGKASKTKAEETAEPDAETRKSQEKEKSAVIPPKQEKKRSFWGRIFGARKEEKRQAEEPGKEQAQTGQESKTFSAAEAFAAQEEVRRQANEVEGLKKLDQAYQAFARNEFENALKIFDDALSIMPVRPHTLETRQKARMSEADCEYRLALAAYREGKTTEAKQSISRALEYYPAHRGAARLSERIKQDEQCRAEVEAQPVPPKKEADYLDKQKRISAELQLGRQYMALKEYDKAENEFKSVLLEDRLNPEASASLKKIAEERFNLDTGEFQRMKAEMLAQIRDTWTPPVKKPVTAPKPGAGETIVASTARKKLLDKLNNIIIPEIDWHDVSIDAIVNNLSKESYALDRDSPPGERGVNFVYMRGAARMPSGTAQPAPKAEEDVFAVQETGTAGSVDIGGGQKIPNLQLRGVSLMRILKIITDSLGLKYEIEENMVIIHPVDVAYGKLERKEYKVLASVLDSLTGGAPLQPAAGEGDKLEIGAGTTFSTERKDIKQIFVSMGIPFPKDTSVTYIPSQSLLIVVNTPENLENLESILSRINVAIDLVEIEARFVEINQEDLEELGMEWLLTDNWELATRTSGGKIERIQANKTDFTKGLREFTVSGGQNIPTPGGTKGNIFSISSILTNPELTVILHALQQRDGVNLLSAPKVTTKSGSEATIKVVEELIYPTEYQQQAQSIGTTTSGNQSLVQVVVTPSAFETRDVGVILTASPTVEPDKETILLAMTPRVVELERWIDYGQDLPTDDPNRTQHMTMLQPVFHSREIITQISIMDGQTVVMGGLIREGQKTTEDKIPLLGDIPLLGYLFKTKTSVSTKKNLLIFVTANLVDTAGNKIKQTPVASVSAGRAASATP